MATAATASSRSTGSTSAASESTGSKPKSTSSRSKQGTHLPRTQVLAYRILASGLDRSTAISDLAIWDVGLQDASGSAAIALAARLDQTQRNSIIDGSWLTKPTAVGDFVLAWSLRGSPHVHRRKDLPQVAAALWPADNADGIARLVGSGAYLSKNDSNSMEALTCVAAAMRKCCREPMAKPDLSAAVTAAIPEEFSGYCKPCGTGHVLEMLFRCGALPGGLGLVPDAKPATLAPLKPTIRTPKKQTGFPDLVGHYLKLTGTATNAEIAGHFGTSAGQLAKSVLPADLETVDIDGVRSQSTRDLATRVLNADADAAREIIRLLPVSDPLLQPRERTVLVPNPAHAKQLWRPIGSPGAVLAGGEIVGLWRPRKSGNKLTFAVEAFANVTRIQRRTIEEEAHILASVRGVDHAEVIFES